MCFQLSKAFTMKSVRFIYILSSIITSLTVLSMSGCKHQPKTGAPEQYSAADSIPYFQKTLSLQNISFEIKASGQGSLGELHIQPAGLSITNRELIHDLDGRVLKAEIEDLNADSYPEILIYIQSAGSGSYGTVIAYSVNNGKSVSQIAFHDISQNPEAGLGYMGHDEFSLIESSLAHRFPIYNAGDTNANPTGGLRQITYKLLDGEASRIFVIEKITDYPDK